MIVAIPTDEADPALRLRRTHEALRGAKERHKALPADLLTDAATFIPPAVAALAARRAMDLMARTRPPVNLAISNVPGPRDPLYLAGARLEANYPVSVVVDGVGLNITVMSYRDHLDFGIVADREQVDDVWSMLEGRWRASRRTASDAPTWALESFSSRAAEVADLGIKVTIVERPVPRLGRPVVSPGAPRDAPFSRERQARRSRGRGTPGDCPGILDRRRADPRCASSSARRTSSAPSTPRGSRRGSAGTRLARGARRGELGGTDRAGGYGAAVLTLARREPSAILFAAQLAGLLVYPAMEGNQVGQAFFSVLGIAILGLVVRAVRGSPAWTWVGVGARDPRERPAAEPDRDRQQQPAAVVLGVRGAALLLRRGRAHRVHARRPRHHPGRAVRRRRDVHARRLGVRVRVRRLPGGRAGELHRRGRPDRTRARGSSSCSSASRRCRARG